VQLFLTNLPKSENSSIECRIIRPDGVIKNIFIKAFLVKDNQGKLISIIGIASDMTEFTHS